MAGSPTMETGPGSDQDAQQNNVAEDAGQVARKSWRDVLNAQPKSENNNKQMFQNRNNKGREIPHKAKLISNENKPVTELQSDSKEQSFLPGLQTERMRSEVHELANPIPSNLQHSKVQTDVQTGAIIVETVGEPSMSQMNPGKTELTHTTQQGIPFSHSSMVSQEHDPNGGPYGPESLGPEQQELLDRTSLMALNAGAAEFSPYGQPMHPQHPMHFMPQMNGNPHVMGPAPFEMMAYYSQMSPHAQAFYGPYAYPMQDKSLDMIQLQGMHGGPMRMQGPMDPSNPYYGYMPYPYAPAPGMYPGGPFVGAPPSHEFWANSAMPQVVDAQSHHAVQPPQSVSPASHPGGTPSPGFSPQRQGNRKLDRGGKSQRNRAEVVRQDGREEGVVNEGKLPQGACAPLSEMEQEISQIGEVESKVLGSVMEEAKSAGQQTRTSTGELDEQFQIKLTSAGQVEDARTTVMIKNIPNKYTQRNLLELIDTNHQGTYDFFYLPIDFKNKCNLGYAFLNFREARFIASFVKDFADKRWERFNSEKVCVVTYARIQGKTALINHFRSSRLMLKHEKYRPIVFSDNGKPETIPAVNRSHGPHRSGNPGRGQTSISLRAPNVVHGPILVSGPPGLMQHSMLAMSPLPAVPGTVPLVPTAGQVSPQEHGPVEDTGNQVIPTEKPDSMPRSTVPSITVSPAPA